MVKELIKKMTILLKEDDYDIREYASKKIAEEYSNDVATLLRRYAKEDFNEDKEIMLLLDMSKLENMSYEDATDIVAEFKDGMKTEMDIDLAMELYKSGDETLVKKTGEFVIKKYEMYIYNIIHTRYSTYADKFTDELFQCGCEGLLKALRNYDPKSAKFNTYCTGFVCHEISAQINFHNNNTTVHFNNIQKKIEDAMKAIKEEGYEPDVQKIHILTDLKPEIIKRELDYIERTKFRYLDADEGLDYSCEYESTPEALYAVKERNSNIYKAIKELPRDQQIIVVMKMYKSTNEDIAERLNTTISKVKMGYQRALHTLKKSRYLAEINAEYRRDSHICMAHFSATPLIPKKTVDEQLKSVMECLGTFQNSKGVRYAIDYNESNGQYKFLF